MVCKHSVLTRLKEGNSKNRQPLLHWTVSRPALLNVMLGFP